MVNARVFSPIDKLHGTSTDHDNKFIPSSSAGDNKNTPRIIIFSWISSKWRLYHL